jgi:hypothetical protein
MTGPEQNGDFVRRALEDAQTGSQKEQLREAIERVKKIELLMIERDACLMALIPKLRGNPAPNSRNARRLKEGKALIAVEKN